MTAESSVELSAEKSAFVRAERKVELTVGMMETRLVGVMAGMTGDESAVELAVLMVEWKAVV